MGYKSLAFIFPASYYYDSLKQVNKQMWEEKVFTSVKLGNSPKASGVFSSTATKIEKWITVIADDKLQNQQGHWW